MKIDSIEVFHLGLPLVKSRETPAGTLETLPTVLVAMTSGETVGWGEASPGAAPLAGPDWAAGVFGCVRDWMAPAVCGATVDSGDDLQEILNPFAGNRYAKAALDTAWWDLNARINGNPLHKMLGGQRDAVPLGTSFDRMESIDELLDAVRGAFEAGYAAVELKFRPGWDIQMVNLVRSEFATEQIHIDVEGGMTLGQQEMLCRLDDFSLAMIEQPLPADDLVAHAMVQEMIRTPICLAEGITTLPQAEMAMELKSCRYVNVEPGRVGGLTVARAIDEVCHSNCTPCRAGAMPQSAVGTRIALALATRPNFSYPAEFFASDALLAEDVADPPTIERSGEGVLQAVLSSEPGIGTVPNAELLEKHCLDRAEIEETTS